MSEVATSLPNENYLKRRFEFDTKEHPVAIPEKKEKDEAKGNSYEPITIEHDEEESSDCDSDRMTALSNVLNSLVQIVQRLNQSNQKHKRKPTRSYFNDQQMHQETTNENEIVSTPERLAGNQCLTVDTHLNNQISQTQETRTDSPPEEHTDQTVTIQSTPNPSSSDNKACVLRDLLENPMSPPKKRFQYKHFKQQMNIRTTDSIPMDLSSFCKIGTNERPSTITLQSETQSYQSSGGHEKQILTNFDNNPQMHPINSEGYSGEHCSYQQAYSQDVENNTKSTAQSTLNQASQPGQSVSQKYIREPPTQRTYERSTVTTCDPRTRAPNLIKHTPIDNLIYSNSSQHDHQFNRGPSQNQNLSTHGSVYYPDHPQMVAQSFTEKQYVVHQIYSQNNENNANPGQPYLQPAFQCPRSFVTPQENLITSSNAHYYQNPPTSLSELLYWAEVGIKAHESMTKIRPSAIYHPIEYYMENQYSSSHLPVSDQDMQSQETPDVNIEEVSNQSFYSENGARNESVIQKTSDQLSTAVQNSTEQQLSPVNMYDSNSAQRTLDIPAETPIDANHNEQNTSFGMNTPSPTTIPYSQDTVNESENPENATEFLHQLNGLFEELKLRTNVINNQLQNKSWFDNSATMDKVMKSVHDYCASYVTNVTADADTSHDASAAIRRDNDNDDDEMDEDYKTDTDGDDDSDREPNRKRIRITFELPPEYDATDTRWTLRYREAGFGLVELMPYSNVFVNERRLMNCKEAAKDSNAFARLLLVEVFSYNALTVCSLTGGRPASYNVEGNNFRPGLDKNAREVLLTFVEQISEEKKWRKTSKNSISNSMRFKLKRMRDNALKYKN